MAALEKKAQEEEKKTPHLSNLNEDPALIGKIQHLIKSGTHRSIKIQHLIKSGTPKSIKVKKPH